MLMKGFRAAAGAVALFAAAAFIGQAAAGESVTVVSWGGEYQKALTKAFYNPTAENLGIELLEDTTNGLPSVRIQVEAGAVTWDVVELGVAECIRGEREGLFEKLDYSVIDADGIDKSLIGDSWIGVITYSTLLAWNSDTYGDNGPQSWADFWDVEKFPGSRSLSSYPEEVLPLALMADGVPLDQIYPLDIDRAFKKLAELKPHIIAWWASGAQSTQMLKDGEVDAVSVWNGRLINVVKDGAHAGYTFNQGILSADCLVIPRGAPNLALAQKVVASLVSPDIQANLPLHATNGPVNMKAFQTGKLTAEQAASVISSPQNAKIQLLQDALWWADHATEVQERFDDFVVE